MFCGCSTDYDGAPPNTPRLPGLPRPAGRAADDQPAGRRARPRDRRRDRGDDARRRPAGTARTTSTRTCRRATRSASTTCRSRRAGRLTFDTSDGPGHDRDHPGPPRGGHGEAHPRDRRRTGARVSLVDFNRSGAPLMEIVTEPDVRSAEQARRYAEELQLLLRAIGASDADMERGQMRVEANVSLRPRGTEPFGTRVEVKNMNSFRSVERAIAFEIERQAAALDAGETLDPGDARLGRGPRRDVRHAVQGGLARLPLLPGAGPAAAPRRRGLAGRDPRPRCRSCRPPAARATRRRSGLSAYDAAVLVAEPRATRAVRGDPRGRPGRSTRRPSRTGSPGRTCGLLKTRPGRRRPRRRAAELGGPDRPRRRRASCRGTNAKEVFAAHAATGDAVARDRRRARASARSPTRGALGADRRRGHRREPGGGRRLPGRQGRSIGFLVGQVMKATRGQANAAIVQAAVRERLDGRRTARDAWSTSCSGSLGVALIAIGYQRCAGPVVALPGAQGAGRERRPLRGVARRRRATTGDDRRVGRDADPPAPGPDRRRDRRSSGSCWSSWGS